MTRNSSWPYFRRFWTCLEYLRKPQNPKSV